MNAEDFIEELSKMDGGDCVTVEEVLLVLVQQQQVIEAFEGMFLPEESVCE